MHKKITTNTKHVAVGDVLFCFVSAEKYLTNDIFNKSSEIYCESGFFERDYFLLNEEFLSKYKFKIKEFKDLKKELIRQLKNNYKIPLNLIAITGTKGKTSTCWFAMQLLGHCGRSCGYIGTLGVYFFNGNKIEKINHDDILTTPAIDELYFYLNELYTKNVDVVFFEASSHSLLQGRIEGLNINCGVFTNLSQDHLDYHQTMDKYFFAKSLLFSKYQKRNSFCVLNKDDGRFDELNSICKENNLIPISIGMDKKSDVHIINIDKLKNNIRKIDFIYKEKIYNFKTDIIGDFQILNIMEAMFSCCLTLKLDINILCNLVSRIKPPIGRMQKVNNTNIFIDFAHTPKSLEESLKLLKQNYKKVVVVFGCGGNRDKKKRPIMCEIALRMAYFVIITTDNPRFEEPNKIIEDITCFFSNKNSNVLLKDCFVNEEIKKIQNKYQNGCCKYKIIENRHEAIKYVVSNYLLLENIAVLIAGKGHENYQIIGDKKYHFDDFEEVIKNIK